jgi:hypothetical protein
VEFKSTNNPPFPAPVASLLKELSTAGFFKESVLIGSWTMLLYHEFFNVSYVLRTMDIDFAIQLLRGKKSLKIDLYELIASHGFTPFLTQSGVEKFSREGFAIEFIPIVVVVAMKTQCSSVIGISAQSHFLLLIS